MTHLIDSDARQWLATIEDQKQELEKTTPLLKAEQKKLDRLRSAKAQEAAAQRIRVLEAQCQACADYVMTNTRDFMQTVLGVLEGTPVAMQDAQGRTLGGLIVSDMSARLLADGTAVFTVSGQSLTQDVLPGLPCADYLLAQESAGQRLVPLV